MLVDILLATYNGKLCLRELIYSLLNQTYPHIRILISDGGSTDGTLKVIKEMARQYACIQLLPSTGRLNSSANFSYLLQQAKAPYFMCADQDDIWLPDKVEKTLAKMQQIEASSSQSVPCLVHTDLMVVDFHLKKISDSFWRYGHLFPRQGSTLNRLLVQNVVTGCALMGNRSLKNMVVSIPPEAIQYDWWLALTAAAFGKIDFINEATILYRQYCGNAIEAKKFSAFKYLMQRFAISKEDDWSYRMRNLAQAQAFFSYYLARLSTSQKEMLSAYCQLLQTRSTWNKVQMAVKYGFCKHGFARNAIILIPKR